MALVLSLVALGGCGRVQAEPLRVALDLVDHRGRALAPPHRTVQRRYAVVLRAVAFTGRMAIASRYAFLTCLRP